MSKQFVQNKYNAGQVVFSKVISSVRTEEVASTSLMNPSAEKALIHF